MSCHGFICLWQTSPYNSTGVREMKRNGESVNRRKGEADSSKPKAGIEIRGRGSGNGKSARKMADKPEKGRNNKELRAGRSSPVEYASLPDNRGASASWRKFHLC